MKKIYALRDLAIRPYGHPGTLNSAVRHEFRPSGRVFEGTPLVIAGPWPIDDAVKIAKLGVLVETLCPHRDWLLYDADERANLVYVPRNPSSIDQFMSTDDRPNYVKVSAGSDGDVERLLELRAKYPELTVFAGPLIGPSSIYGMADAVVVGYSPGADEWMLEKFGAVADPAHLLTCPQLEGQDKVAAFSCETLGDMAKLFALGAEFVEVGPSLSSFTIEHLIAGLQASCYVLGADSPHALPNNCEVGFL